MEHNSMKLGTTIHADRTVRVMKIYNFTNDKQLKEILDYLDRESCETYSVCLLQNQVESAYYDDYFKVVKQYPLLASDVDFTGSEEE